MRRLKLDIGSTVELGTRALRVAALVTEEPEASVGFLNMGPRLMFNLADLPSTQLVQPGSRVSYRLFVAGEGEALGKFRRHITQVMQPGQRIEDIRDARPEIKSALERAERFLGLSALLTVILAGVAVALAARRHVQRHLDACAMMRCLGASQRRILTLHALQLAFIGLAASLAGCAVGYLCQEVLVALLGSLVPVKIPRAGWLPVAQGLALHQLHDDEELARVFPDVENGADIGMVQRRRGACLGAEPLDGLAVVEEVLRDELHRDFAAQADILGAIDDPHAAFAGNENTGIGRVLGGEGRGVERRVPQGAERQPRGQLPRRRRRGVGHQQHLDPADAGQHLLPRQRRDGDGIGGNLGVGHGYSGR